jgi:polyferredoxin
MKRDSRLFPPAHRFPMTIKAAGDWLQRSQSLVRRMQWGLVFVYYFLLLVPALLPPPGSRAAALHSLAGWAEILFWGLWWPGVVLSMLLFGQFWCGIFCPDGTLTEFASRHGRGGKIPAWVRWTGWPLAAYSLIVVYEHLVKASQTPRALLLSLGGASLLALICGYFLGRGKRIWCRYLCPVSSMFSLLARCAVFHFKVDREAWDNAPKPLPRGVDCPPLLDVRRLRSNEKCSMCGRCSGHRNAVALSARWPGSEIVNMTPEEIRLSDAFGICFVLIGLCYGTMYWRALETAGLLPFPDLAAIPKILLLAATLGGSTAIPLLATARLCGKSAIHLAYALIPLAGLGLFSSALEHPFLLLHEAGFAVENLRRFAQCACMAIGASWSILLARQIMKNPARAKQPRAALCLFALLTIALGAAYAGAPGI